MEKVCAFIKAIFNVSRVEKIKGIFSLFISSHPSNASNACFLFWISLALSPVLRARVIESRFKIKTARFDARGENLQNKGSTGRCPCLLGQNACRTYAILNEFWLTLTYFVLSFMIIEYKDQKILKYIVSGRNIICVINLLHYAEPLNVN